MQKIWNKGHRIRASDKHLVYHYSIGTLLFMFVAVLLLLNIKIMLLYEQLVLGLTAFFVPRKE